MTQVMPTATAKINTSIAGLPGGWDQSITNDGVDARQPDMIAAKVSTAWDYDTTTLTLPESHGITTGNTVDLFWTDANGVGRYRYGVTVGTVDGNSVPVSGGTGTAFPPDDTVITICKQIDVVIEVDGDQMTFAFASLTQGDSSPSLLILTMDNASTHVYYLAPNSGLLWFSGIGSDNPYAGRTVASATVSTSKSTGTGTINPITFAFLVDTTS